MSIRTPSPGDRFSDLAEPLRLFGLDDVTASIDLFGAGPLAPDLYEPLSVLGMYGYRGVDRGNHRGAFAKHGRAA